VRLEIQDLVINSSAGAAPPLAATIQPKEWRDTTSVRLGGDFNAVPGIFTARAGIFYEQNAIPDETFDLSVVDSRKVGVSTGFSLGYFGFKLFGAVQHIFMEPRHIENSLVVSQNALNGTPLGGGNTLVAVGDYTMSHNLLSAGLTVDVGELALRVKAATQGDAGWWKPEGPKNGTLLDAGGWLQRQSNL
jgi:long-subunit fatty acid transport protein